MEEFTNKPPNHDIVLALTNIVKSLGCTIPNEDNQSEPKSKKFAKGKEPPRNPRNVVEKLAKLEPKDMQSFTNEIENQFISETFKNSENVQNDLIGKFYTVNSSYIFTDLNDGCKYTIKSFCHESNLFL